MTYNPMKMEATRATQAAGTWPEARLFRIAEKKRLQKEEGYSGADANEASWELMAARFCPEVFKKNVKAGVKGTIAARREAKDKAIAVERKAAIAEEAEAEFVETDSDDAAPEAPADVEEMMSAMGTEAPPADLVRDTLWVYENLSNARVKLADCPSKGAWGLYKWARDARNRFFEQFLPKALAARREDETLKENVRENDRQVAEIRKILGQLLEDR